MPAGGPALIMSGRDELRGLGPVAEHPHFQEIRAERSEKIGGSGPGGIVAHHVSATARGGAHSPELHAAQDDPGPASIASR